MNLQETIRELHTIDQQLWSLEGKYGVLSPEFYQAMMAGELAEFDGKPGYHDDFLSWLAWYEVRLDYEQRYRDLLRRRHILQQLRTVAPAA